VPVGLSLDVFTRTVSQERPPASEDALRIALRLRECPSTRGGRLLLFVPASSGDSVDRLVYETTRALEQLREGPVLVLDLEHRDGDGRGWFSQWPTAAAYHARQTDGAARPAATPAQAPVLYAQPIASAAAAIPYLASPEFAGVVAAARDEFAYVICAVGPISDAVESLVAAALCDGVVLSVTAHRTTMAEVQTASRQLARARAPVLGFVVNRDASSRTV
jgi:hypothetical protein